VKASTERKIIRWIHIIASIPIIGYIYGPVKNFSPCGSRDSMGTLSAHCTVGTLVMEGQLGKKMGTQKISRYAE